MECGGSLLNAENIEYIPSYDGRIGIGYQFSPIFSVKANLGYGKLDGDFSNHNKELLESDYLEAVLLLRIDFLSIFGGYNGYRKINIYPHLGAGQMQSKVKYLNRSNNTVTHIGYSGVGTPGTGISSRLVALTYTLGLEINMNLSKNVSVYLDMSTFYADSDRIDGIPILNSSNDWYNTCNIGLNFKLRKRDANNKLNCEKTIQRPVFNKSIYIFD